MHLPPPPKCGRYLKSGQRYVENYRCTQTVVLHERWSLTTGFDICMWMLGSNTLAHRICICMKLHRYCTILRIHAQKCACTCKVRICVLKYPSCFFLKKFLLNQGPFCGATGTLCFGLWMTLPVSFKVAMDRSSPAVFYHLC